MAAQIIYGKMMNKEISFAGFDETINLTDYLKKVCRTYFVDKLFLEDEEEITYPVITTDEIYSLLGILEESETELWAELKEARGAERKSELLGNLKDVAFMKNTIIKMLLQDCPNTEKLLVLI